ncbi:hypothetical protein B0T19DRAFT_461567 [Cercophora scortea]|uniref:Ankyrin n=1 Tax=Cercophora scortea TaxID=314031 RepID=A0AAE0INB5_9PEZI|nr:hypothetical protein B0T19DRAFT_461567 [Cercophora scortea]
MAFAIQHAKQLLQAHRAVQDGEQPFGRLRSPFSSNDAFTYQEVNRVLGEVVDSDGPVGVINALLALGADVNFHMRQKRSKITRKQQDGQRSDLLLRATLRCQAETVNAIAAHADQENLDRALHHAIVRGDLDVVRALLNHGASPVHLHDDFQDAIFQDQVGLVGLLLSGHRLPCLACRSTGLRIAVKNRSLAIASLLLRYWADVNYDNAVALLRAVEISRPDLVSVLISGPVRPSPRSLDAAVGKAHDLMGKNDTQAERQIIETCLSAGAAGPSTTRLMTEGLIVAVQRGHTELLNAILRLRKPQGQYEAFALLEAIRAGQVTTLIKLLEFSPSPASLTVAASQAMKINDAQARYATAKLLIQAGATGACTADALVKTVQRLTSLSTPSEKAPAVAVSDKAVDEQLLRLLLDEGKADVDFGDGEALQSAVQWSYMPIAEAIVARRPSAESLGAALPWAMNISDQQQRQEMVTLLLRHEISPESAGKALVEAFKAETPDLPLIETLLTRASVNWSNGEVFINAIRNFHPDVFRMLLSQGISYKALFTATHEALRCPERSHRRAILGSLLGRLQLDHLNTALKHIILERETDISLASVLLDAGAEATYQDGVCIKNAACHLNISALRLLAEHSGPSESIFTHAFAAVINRGRQWIAFEHVEIVQLLLRHGASEPVVNKAMVDVVDHLACQDSELADVLLNIFFAAGAQADYENGKAVAIAAGRGDVSLLSRLLRHGATSTTATLALTTAIMAHHEEPLLLRIIEVFADQRTAVANVNKPLPGMPSSLLLCLKSYGHSVVLLDRLVSMAAGCDLESTVPHHVYPEDPISRDEGRAASATMEPVSVLMWALLQPAKMISSAVIAALIRHGADVSYTTPKTRVTPLLLAAQSGRCDVAELLLEAGAKISTRDVFGRSALFFASGLGDVNLVTLLLSRHPSNNDGSLHEASRSFHIPVIQLLLDAGNDPNHRSSRHQGRTPLGELALNGTIPSNITTAEAAIDLLSAAGASPLLKIHGKTTIFLALDNKANNLPMTRLLLDKLLHRTLNSQENVYQYGIYHHSPTMYVTKGLLQGTSSPALIQLLRDHGAEDHFYATLGEVQPPDARGLPEEFREYENERQARERRIQKAEDEHARYLRWERENEARGISRRAMPAGGREQNRNTSYSDSWAMANPPGAGAHTRQRHSEGGSKAGTRAQKSFADLRYQSRLQQQQQQQQQQSPPLPSLSLHERAKYQGNGLVNDQRHVSEAVLQISPALRQRGIMIDTSSVKHRSELEGTPTSPRARDGSAAGGGFMWAGRKLEVDHLYEYQHQRQHQQEWPVSPVAAVELEARDSRMEGVVSSMV